MEKQKSDWWVGMFVSLGLIIILCTGLALAQQNNGTGYRGTMEPIKDEHVRGGYRCPAGSVAVASQEEILDLLQGPAYTLWDDDGKYPPPPDAVAGVGSHGEPAYLVPTIYPQTPPVCVTK